MVHSLSPTAIERYNGLSLFLKYPADKVPYISQSSPHSSDPKTSAARTTEKQLRLPMAISFNPAPVPPAVPASLLATLRVYTRLLETRRALQSELDSALSSFLSGRSTPLSPAPPGDAQRGGEATPPSPDGLADAASGTPTPPGLPTCASEAIRPPSQPELEQALQIGFGGLLELQEEARLVQGWLGDRWNRDDLRRTVERIERWESERMKATLERDQMRRLATLQPELDFASLVDEKNALRATLAAQVQEEVQEIHAEIAELAAAESDAA